MPAAPSSNGARDCKGLMRLGCTPSAFDPPYRIFNPTERRRNTMRQKFHIQMNGAGTHLNIKEFAVVDHHLNRTEFSSLQDDSFCLLCESTYEQKTIADSIAAGIGKLIATLRTISFFPNRRLATQIAEVVLALNVSPGAGGVDLFFDDDDIMTTREAILGQA
jgi:hypothetical protein